MCRHDGPLQHFAVDQQPEQATTDLPEFHAPLKAKGLDGRLRDATGRCEQKLDDLLGDMNAVVRLVIPEVAKPSLKLLLAPGSAVQLLGPKDGRLSRVAVCNKPLVTLNLASIAAALAGAGRPILLDQQVAILLGLLAERTKRPRVAAACGD